MQIPNTFTSYEMTDKEQIESLILTTLQKQQIQTHRAQLAEKKLALEFDPAEPQLFMQQEAYTRGQLDLLTYMLEASEAAEIALVNGTSLQSDVPLTEE